MESTIGISEVFERLSPALCEITGCARKVAIATYRALLGGTPVIDEQIAATAELDVTTVESVLRGELASLVYRNDSDEVLGFGGLAVVPMNHRFEFDGQTLFTWCAWDSLFLAELLQIDATVVSQCPQTGTEIRVRVDGSGVKGTDPEEVLLSFLLPDAPLFEQATEKTISSFCHHIHFLAGTAAADAWCAANPGTFAMSLDDGYELGRMNNRARFGKPR